MYPDVGTFVLIRPTQTFYERINFVSHERASERRGWVDFLGTEAQFAHELPYSMNLQTLVGLRDRRANYFKYAASTFLNAARMSASSSSAQLS